MSNEMMTEILQRLDKLGELLGDGAAFGWEIYMRQAILRGGVLGIFAALAWAAAAYGCYRLFAWSWWRYGEIVAANKACGGRYSWERDDDIPCAIGMALAGVVGVVAVIMAAVSGFDAVSHLLNPQYYALKDLLKALKP